MEVCENQGCAVQHRVRARLDIAQLRTADTAQDCAEQRHHERQRVSLVPAVQPSNRQEGAALIVGVWIVRWIAVLCNYPVVWQYVALCTRDSELPLRRNRRGEVEQHRTIVPVWKRHDHRVGAELASRPAEGRDAHELRPSNVPRTHEGRHPLDRGRLRVRPDPARVFMIRHRHEADAMLPRLLHSNLQSSGRRHLSKRRVAVQLRRRRRLVEHPRICGRIDLALVDLAHVLNDPDKPM